MSFLLVDGIIAGLVSMLSEPQPDMAVNTEAAALLIEDKKEFKRRCRAVMRRAEQREASRDVQG